MQQGKSSTGLAVGGGFQAATAGVTQTQAGATQITNGNVLGTTGTANDGFGLPRNDQPTQVGQEVIIQNSSTNAAKVWPAYLSDTAAGDGSAIDGGSANAAVTLAASTTNKFVSTAIKTWKSLKLS